MQRLLDEDSIGLLSAQFEQEAQAQQEEIAEQAEEQPQLAEDDAMKQKYNPHERNLQIMALFSDVQGKIVNCTIENCGQKIVKGHGTTNCERHLKLYHPNHFEALPWAEYVRERANKRQRESMSQTATILATPKKKKVEQAQTVSIVDLLMLLCRLVLPFTAINDKTFVKIHQGKLNDKNVGEFIERLALDTMERFVKSCAGMYVSLFIDSGTIHKTRSLDIVAVVNHVARVVRVVSGAHQTAANICKELVAIAQRFIEAGANVIQLTSDAASNMMKGCALAAEKLGGVVVLNCGCHLLQLLAKIILRVYNLDELIQKCQQAPATELIPKVNVVPIIDSRWNATYLAAESISTNGAHFLANKAITEDELKLIRGALNKLQVFYRHTLKLEKEGTCVVHTIAALCEATNTVFDIDADAYLACRNRNLQAKVLLAAIYLIPSFQISLLAPVDQQCIHSAFLACFGEDETYVAMETEMNKFEQGFKHQCWRTSAQYSHSLDLFWENDAYGGEFQLLQDVWRKLHHIGCSSSCVERAFWRHARVHSDLRTRLASNKVEAQLMMHYFEKAELQRPAEPLPGPADFEDKIQQVAYDLCCAQRYANRQHLQPGNKIKIFYENTGTGRLRRRYQHYTALLLEQHKRFDQVAEEEGEDQPLIFRQNSWSIKFTQDQQRAQQIFDPDVDMWEPM